MSLTEIQVLDVEEELCRHLLDDKSFRYIIQEGIDDALVINPAHRSILAFAKGHYAQTGAIPSPAVFATEFPRFQFTAPDSAVEWVVSRLRERYLKTNLEQVLFKAANRVKEPREALDVLRSYMLDIERTTLSNESLFTGEHVDLFFEELAESIAAEQFKGISIGFKEIDDFTGGTKPGQLAFILARPKRQKTFLELNAFIANIILGNRPLFETNEVTMPEIKQRLACMISGVSWDEMQKGRIVPGSKVWKQMIESWRAFNDKYGKDYFIEMAPPGERKVSQIFAKADRFEAQCLFVSQFKYLEGTKDFYRSEYEKYPELATDLKVFATRKGKEIPVIVEAQFNRGGDSMEELMDFDAGKVGLTDQIPQVCDSIFAIFQDYELFCNKLLEFGVVMGRSHGIGSWYIESELVTETRFGVNRKNK